MFKNTLHRVLLFVLAVQKLGLDDTQRRQLLDEEKEAIEKDIAELHDDETKTVLSHIVANAAAQPVENAAHGLPPEIPDNPLGLAPGQREVRIRERESSGLILGKSVGASAPPPPAVPADSSVEVPPSQTSDSYAVASLEASLSVARNNRQVAIDEGRAEEADMYDRRIEDLEDALFNLRSLEKADNAEHVMRAKVNAASVSPITGEQQTLGFVGVSKKDGYDDTGLDEDNTFAKFSPSVGIQMTVANPVLLGVVEPGDVFYVDFLRLPKPPVVPAANAVPPMPEQQESQPPAQS